MIELIGKKVVVEAMGITYTGRLVEMGETEVHLEGESGWIVVPVENISSIREAD
ncbi:MAG: hypothetical protein Q8J64_02810 [Thermodesulfovibrionales bacterium]|nr:hypothetical protein [Thermodesulfovibrionales bacterium]